MYAGNSNGACWSLPTLQCAVTLGIRLAHQHKAAVSSECKGPMIVRYEEHELNGTVRLTAIVHRRSRVYFLDGNHTSEVSCFMS